MERCKVERLFSVIVTCDSFFFQVVIMCVTGGDLVSGLISTYSIVRCRSIIPKHEAGNGDDLSPRIKFNRQCRDKTANNQQATHTTSPRSGFCCKLQTAPSCKPAGSSCISRLHPLRQGTDSFSLWSGTLGPIQKQVHETLFPRRVVISMTAKQDSLSVSRWTGLVNTDSSILYR